VFYRSILFVVVLLLASCAAPSFNAPIENISSEQLESYWHFDEHREASSAKLIGTVSGCYRVLPLRMVEKFDIKIAAKLSIALAIDSKGNTYEHSLVEGTANATVDKLIVSVLAKRFKMIAAEENTSKTPVRVTEEVALFASGKYCLPYANPEQLMEAESRDIWAEERVF